MGSVVLTFTMGCFPSGNATAEQGRARESRVTITRSMEVNFFIRKLLSNKWHMSGWLMGNYGQVLVTVGTDNELPFTVALTVSVYCKPLVTLCVPLKARKPVPDAYQVFRQVFPCHN